MPYCVPGYMALYHARTFDQGNFSVPLSHAAGIGQDEDDCDDKILSPAAAEVGFFFESDLSDTDHEEEMPAISTDVELTWQAHAALMLISNSEAFNLATLSREKDCAMAETALQVQERHFEGQSTCNVQFKQCSEERELHAKKTWDESPKSGPCSEERGCSRHQWDPETRGVSTPCGNSAKWSTSTKTQICRLDKLSSRSPESRHSVFSHSAMPHTQCWAGTSTSSPSKRDHGPKTMPLLEGMPTQSPA